MNPRRFLTTRVVTTATTSTVWLFSAQVFAQQKAAVNVTGGSYIDVVVGLGIVVALIYVLAFFAKRLNGIAYTGKVPLKILGGVSLGTRERAVLVEVGGKHLLLGVAP